LFVFPFGLSEVRFRFASAGFGVYLTLLFVTWRWVA